MLEGAVLVTTHVVTGRLSAGINLLNIKSELRKANFQHRQLVTVDSTYPEMVLADIVVVCGTWGTGVARMIGADILPLGTDILATAAVPEKSRKYSLGLH